ncbi:MAG TPA: amino acid ABC transporter permease [Methanocorpusculum sp.]|nr:amino acid ABC transporter permease [Methanocorpusculum sp.]
MIESFGSVTNAFGYLVGGTIVTLELVGLSLLVGFIIGILLCLGQVYGSKVIRGVIHIYVWFFRGIPNLILLFLFYFAIFPMVKLNIPPFVVAFIVLGMRSAAYQSQIFRGVVESLAEGQMLAARSLGMTKFQSILFIIIPQTLRLALPSWANEYPVLLTDSAVASAIGVTELLARTGHQVAATGNIMSLYLSCAAIFIILNCLGMFIIQGIEKRIRIHGFGNNECEQI